MNYIPAPSGAECSYCGEWLTWDQISHSWLALGTDRSSTCAGDHWNNEDAPNAGQSHKVYLIALEPHIYDNPGWADDERYLAGPCQSFDFMHHVPDENDEQCRRCGNFKSYHEGEQS